jgi:hypothetical protein
VDDASRELESTRPLFFEEADEIFGAEAFVWDDGRWVREKDRVAEGSTVILLVQSKPTGLEFETRIEVTELVDHFIRAGEEIKTLRERTLTSEADGYVQTVNKLWVYKDGVRQFDNDWKVYESLRIKLHEMEASLLAAADPQAFAEWQRLNELITTVRTQIDALHQAAEDPNEPGDEVTRLEEWYAELYTTRDELLVEYCDFDPDYQSLSAEAATAFDMMRMPYSSEPATEDIEFFRRHLQLLKNT